MSLKALPRMAAAIVAACVSAACHIDFVPKAEQRDEWKRSYEIAATGELEIENSNGKIVVRPGTGNTVEIVATRVAKAGSDEAAKKLLADTGITESASPSSIRIASRRPSGVSFSGAQYHVDYEVRAPAGIALKLSATNGTVDVQDWNGRVVMSATNGTLEGRGLRGEVEAETTNGKIDVVFAQLSDRGAKFDTTNGEVVVSLPKDAKARIMANVTNGGISVNGLDNLEASPSNTRRRYEAAVNGGGPTVSIETTNGGISVRGM